MSTTSDTATVLTVILGPIAVALFLLLIGAWWKIRCLEHDKKMLIIKVAEVEKHDTDATRKLAEVCAQKDDEIQRQKKEIIELHGALETGSNVSGGGPMT